MQYLQVVVILLAVFVGAYTAAGGKFKAGGWSTANGDEEGVQTAAAAATKNISDAANSLYQLKLVRVVEAKKQVVSGMKYNLTLELSHTNCRKDAVAQENVDNCQLTGKPQFCRVTVWSQPWIGPPKVTHSACSDSLQIKERLSLEEQLFHNFLETYKKSYHSQEEQAKRFKIFKKNMKMINLLNMHERGTATYGVTQFSDLTEKEFSRKHLGFRPDLRSNDVHPQKKAEIVKAGDLPEAFDWRDKNVVTEVKNQGVCGSCWAFSTTGNIEGMWAIQKKQLVSLSEQELVDCDKVDEGCNGGLPSNAYLEIIKLGGLETESEYPYKGVDSKCIFNKTEVRVYINDSVALSQDETEMANFLVTKGPISIGINANAMQFYFGGISHPPKFLCSPTNLDHGVLIVGYGVHTYPIFKTTMPFWIVKNSWGKTWGEQGYYRVYRGDGTCGLNQMATSAVVL